MSLRKPRLPSAAPSETDIPCPVIAYLPATIMGIGEAHMKRWFAIWTIFALFIMARSAWYDPLYRNMPCSTPPLVCDLNWMGAVYVALHRLIAVGTVDFFASWLFLLVPPFLLWYMGAAILAVARRVATMLGLRQRNEYWKKQGFTVIDR
jgi:hypothetical protein